MLFPQQTASRNEVGFVSQLASRWRHNDGAGIEMLHRGTESCNGSSFCQWAEQRVPVERTVGDTLKCDSTSAGSSCVTYEYML